PVLPTEDDLERYGFNESQAWMDRVNAQRQHDSDGRDIAGDSVTGESPWPESPLSDPTATGPVPSPFTDPITGLPSAGIIPEDELDNPESR
ncbi:hypothetical protein HY546_03605, partial [archaeon]|nr:hypothetical protein [archaeon]